MATRNLSIRFVALRSASHAHRAAAKSSNAAATSAAIDEEAGLPLVDFSDAAPVGQPPAWVAMHEQITKDLNLTREQSQSRQARAEHKRLNEAASNRLISNGACLTRVCLLLLFPSRSVRALQRLHATRLRVSFGDDIIAEQEASIENLTQQITSVSALLIH